MAKYSGRKGRLYASVSGGAVAVPVASLTDWALNFTTARTEVTSFGDGNKNYVQGLPDVAGTFTGFWDDTDTTLQTAAGSPTGTNLYLYVSTDASTRYAYGPAWVDCSFTTPIGGAVGFNGTFAANGTWDAII